MGWGERQHARGADEMLAAVDEIGVEHLAAEHRAACEEIHRLRAELDLAEHREAEATHENDQMRRVLREAFAIDQRSPWERLHQAATAVGLDLERLFLTAPTPDPTPDTAPAPRKDQPTQ